jgi:hypothetical protein
MVIRYVMAATRKVAQPTIIFSCLKFLIPDYLDVLSDGKLSLSGL